MRIYGMRSGRNNMNRLITRSIMYNTPKKNKNVNKQNEEDKKLWDDEHSIASLFAWIITLIIVSPLLWLAFNW